MIPIRRGYVCLACGNSIVVTQTLREDLPDTHIGWSMTVEHTGQMDAACRLVTEVLADEQRAMLNESVAHAAADLGGAR